MSRPVFWSLALVSLAVGVVGVVVERGDLHYGGAVAALGVVAVHRLLLALRGGEEQ
ncbi:hypothetical protein GPZ77_17835 [Streptomyces sp. QHH-9511]|uniref:hypothetical protein n=1 Tax=Streptomyces sp. QHH-9511 TaxID=2684468 RepID=UPI0013184724|nr:hypothetical protein [Streptomyces sp. QHH-9511]QGZ49986.1 hypothetical protein GPZ77_17835 [Streptomyces sp. QHH-9511]